MGTTEELDIVIKLRSLAAKQVNVLRNSLLGVQKVAGGLGKVFGSLQVQLAGIFGGAAVGLFVKSSIDVFTKFDDTLRAAGAVANATADEMKLLSNTAKEMGKTTRFSAAEAADGLRLLGMAGFEVNESIGALPGVLNLAAAGGLELGQSADIATNVLSGFGLEVEDLASVNDVLVKTFTSANTNLVELGDGFKLVGPIANAVGADFEDLVGSLGKLADAGLKGTLGGTSLRGAMSALLNPTKEEAKLMEDLAARIGQTSLEIRDANGNFVGFRKIVKQLEDAGLDGAEALKLFGDRAGPGMAALLDVGSEELSNYIEELKDASGTAERTAAMMEAGIGGASREAAAALEGVKIALSEAFNDELIATIRNIRDFLTDLIAEITRLDQEGTLKEWASVAKKSIEGLAEAVRILVDGFLVAGRAISTVALVITGNWDAAKDSLIGTFEQIDALLGVEYPVQNVYKIDKATGEVAKTTTRTASEVKKLKEEYAKLSVEGQAQIAKLAAAESKINGPIGSRGAKKQLGTVEVEVGPSQKAKLQSDVTKLQAIISKEMTAIDIMYDRGVVSLEDYFSERENLLRESVQAEIQLLEAASAAESDLDKRQAINDKIFKQKQDLEKALLQLTQDRLKEEEAAQKEQLKIQEEINNRKLAIEQVFNDVKARVEAGSQGQLEAEFQKELSDLQQRQNAELQILRDSKAQEAAINEYERQAQLERDQLSLNQTKRLYQARLDIASNIAGGIGDIFQEMYDLSGKQSKEMFYITKAAKLAEATINIANAVIGALGAPPYGTGAILNATLIGSLGAAQLAKIARTGLAEGGEVPGSSPHPKADNILARLTAGEFVHPISAVQYYGKSVMEAIRNRSIPKEIFSGFGLPSMAPLQRKFAYASGGMVAAPAPPQVNEGSSESNEVKIFNFTDRNELLSALSSPEGERALINVISSNRERISRVLR
jgi:TP901 family phage tail tape measure protein